MDLSGIVLVVGLVWMLSVTCVLAVLRAASVADDADECGHRPAPLPDHAGRRPTPPLRTRARRGPVCQ